MTMFCFVLLRSASFCFVPWGPVVGARVSPTVVTVVVVEQAVIGRGLSEVES